MRIAVLVLAGGSLAFGSLPAAPQSTTRIETRPFYGAVVTVEEGVRVFRPLPPHDRIIIQPDGKEQASLGSSQPEACACDRTYLRRVGDDAASSRYLRRVGEPRLGGGKP
jgi:hypothetical protein